MIIKVCGMVERDNILQLVEKDSPDLMGLIFYEKSPRFVGKQAIDLDFFKSLPIQKVGVFVNADIENILQKINDFSLDYVQLHGDESVEFINMLKKRSAVKVIKVVKVGTQLDWQEVKPFDDPVDVFLFDTQTRRFGGSGRQFDWAVLEGYPLQRGFLLSGGVDGESADLIEALALKVPKLLGVDINSRFEKAPGLKDIEKTRAFVKRIRGIE